MEENWKGCQLRLGLSIGVLLDSVKHELSVVEMMGILDHVKFNLYMKNKFKEDE